MRFGESRWTREPRTHEGPDLGDRGIGAGEGSDLHEKAVPHTGIAQKRGGDPGIAQPYAELLDTPRSGSNRADTTIAAGRPERSSASAGKRRTDRRPWGRRPGRGISSNPHGRAEEGTVRELDHRLPRRPALDTGIHQDLLNQRRPPGVARTQAVAAASDPPALSPPTAMARGIQAERDMLRGNPFHGAIRLVVGHRIPVFRSEAVPDVDHDGPDATASARAR